MLLVSEDMLNSYKQQQLLTPTTVKKMTALDGEMGDILERNDIDETQEAKLYHHALSRFMEYRGQAKGDLKSDSHHREASSDTDDDETPTLSTDVEEEILAFVPQNMKRAAATIIQRMKSFPSKVSWDGMGHLVIGTKSIPNTNIIDLVYDAVNAKGKKAPRGSQEFYSALKDINVSESAIKNKKRLQQIQLPVPSSSAHTGTSKIPRYKWTLY